MQESIMWNPQETPLKPVEKPTQLKKLLNSSDMQHIAQRRLHFISVNFHGKSFYATLEQSVPCNTVINRDREQNIIGFPLVAGG